jgi:hypothetical protein
VGVRPMNAISKNALQGMAILKLLFPTAVIRWLMLIMLAVFFIAFVLRELLNLDLIGIIAGLAGIHLLMIGMLTIPSQMVAFASSRTASFLAGPRALLLVFYWLISLLLTLAICWLWDLTQLSHYSPLMFLVVWFVVSLTLQGSVYICARWPLVHIFLFSAYAMLNDFIYWLEIYNPFYLAFCILVTWVVFSRWWLSWKSAKYKVNYFFVGMGAHQKMIWDHQANSWFYSASAKTWLGSRLTGLPDGLLARTKRILPTLVYTPLGFTPGYFLMGEEWVKNFSLLFLLAGGGILALGVLSGYGLNLHRIWLINSGPRNELFSFLQKRFWFDVLPLTLLLILSAIGVCLLWGGWQSLEAWVYFLISLFLLQILMFHLYWWAYQRTRAKVAWSSLVLLLWWFLMSIATGFLIKGPASWPTISPLWIVIPELVLLALLYKPVRLGFVNVNFVGAGK